MIKIKTLFERAVSIPTHMPLAEGADRLRVGDVRVGPVQLGPEDARQALIGADSPRRMGNGLTKPRPGLRELRLSLVALAQQVLKLSNGLLPLGILRGIVVQSLQVTAGIDVPLELHDSAAHEFSAWWALGVGAIDAVLAGRPASAARVQLWPEHFDIGTAVGEVNLGASPGDSFCDEPYLYVGPWGAHIPAPRAVGTRYVRAGPPPSGTPTT